MINPTLDEIAAHCKQAINMALNKDGETSYTLSFDVRATEKDLKFIFYSPSALLLNQELYNRLTSIISTNAYPYFTVFPQPSPLLVPWETDNIHKARAWAFPWKRGISKRLVINDVDSFLDLNAKDGNIWLMKNYCVNINSLTSVAIMGLSGSGKTILTKWLNSNAARMGKIITIDPKGSKDLVWWARDNNQEIIYPSQDVSKSDFLSKVNDKLSQVLQLVYQRQSEYLQSHANVNKKFLPVVVTIDELSALTTGANKRIVDSFFSLLQTITLLARESNVHLVLISQELDAKTIPTSVRSQCYLRILMGLVNSKSCQYLFPDYDVSSIVVPSGVATGIIQKINSNDVPAITPFLAPTVKGW